MSKLSSEMGFALNRVRRDIKAALNEKCMDPDTYTDGLAYKTIENTCSSTITDLMEKDMLDEAPTFGVAKDNGKDREGNKKERMFEVEIQFSDEGILKKAVMTFQIVPRLKPF